MIANNQAGIKKPATATFNRHNGGILQAYCYSDNIRINLTGAESWGEFYNDATKSSPESDSYYYIPHDDIKLAQKFAQMAQQQANENSPPIHNYIQTNKDSIEAIMDFGVGLGAFQDKVRAILKALPHANQYYGIDNSQDMLDAVDQKAKKHVTKTKMHCGDFHSPNIEMPAGRTLAVCLGSAITNQPMMEAEGIPRKHLVAELGKFLNTIKENDLMFFTWDANKDLQKSGAAYNHWAWKAHVVGITFDIANEMKTGGNFSPKLWKYELQIDENTYTLHHCIVATQPQILETAEQNWQFNEGERFVIVNQIKYPLELFVELCEQAGFIIEGHIEHNTIKGLLARKPLQQEVLPTLSYNRTQEKIENSTTFDPKHA